MFAGHGSDRSNKNMSQTDVDEQVARRTAHGFVNQTTIDASIAAAVAIAAQAQNWKPGANYATAAALPTVVYANGTNGIGATLTKSTAGALSVDGGSPTVGMRVIVKDQVSTLQNGIYVVTVAGSGAAAFVLTRATDFDKSTEILAGDACYCISGTANAGKTFGVTSAGSPVLGTDAITFGVRTVSASDVGLGNVDNTSDATKNTAAATLTNKIIDLTAAHAVDNTYQGLEIAGLNAGGTLAQFDAVYISGSSTLLAADANGSGTFPAKGLAVAAYVNGNAAKFLTYGTVRHDAWNWTPNSPIYLSGTAGGLTQTVPAASADNIQVVGYALTADIAFFDFNSNYVTLT